jgi:uncharacterized protein DUF4062
LTTDGKKYQTFVSSTFEDLKIQRRMALEAIVSLKDIPSGMEYFPAANENSWSLIEQIIDNCDYYVLILGGRYGTVSDDGRSFTEREYDYAISQQIPVLSFIREGIENLPGNQADHDPIVLEKLTAFRDRVMTSHNVRKWTTDAEFTAAFYTSYISARETYDRPGWIRTTSVLTPDGQRELLRLREQYLQVTAQLASMNRGQQALAGTLARGADTLSIGWRTFTIETSPSAIDGLPAKITRRVNGEGNLDMSWDEIFADLGAQLFDPIAESRVRNIFNSMIASKVGAGTPSQLQVNSESFQIVKTQFLALNLIETTRTDTTLRGSKIFWSLTPYGRSHLFDLRAIHRTD